MSAAGGYVINDIYDIKSDTINRPERPLVSGKITKTNAIVFYLALLLSSLLIAYFSQISGLLFFTLIINIVLFLYALYVKRTAIIGNLLVSACVGAVFIICNLILDEPSQLASGMSVFATAATFLRENFKSIEDIEGDTHAGYRTLPVLLGAKQSMIISGFLCVAFGGILIYRTNSPIATDISHTIWTMIALISGISFIGVGILALTKPTASTAHKNSLYTKLIMLLVIISIFWM
ncbi:MAG: UbiA family prenyltransferase [Bacteroidetes bacterium]|nr:UbiA family prenyltransferase [Bacteroidota bacterium]